MELKEHWRHKVFYLKIILTTGGLLNDTNDKLYFLKEIKGKSIAFFSATTKEKYNNKQKSLSRIVSVDNQIFYDEIKKLKPNVDFIFVIIHGDNEMISYPSPSFKEKCKKAIDCGADAVITHHPHVVGVEKYKEGLIFYSLGDFIFYGESKYRRRGVILSIFSRIKKSNLICFQLV